ncbi:cystathionine beta-lyase [Streptococcus lactarius]|uniref:Cystathionine beta-lyase n=1 Tax=Streptococcus lactarius TaxID=684066 RepID=A0A9X0WQ55_9STRE|nr:cystathionine beta-lyase [Streptococcus lactarius]MBK4780250.1 cystathionine beta-lyase [Streptococcus lactarius]QUB38314.1 cystathionine beta-lyase [Streptococcus lactarius]
MTDYVDLAIKYGGYTSLDRVYLTNLLGTIPEDLRLRMITPPPSVLNAYFAELYQKKSPKEAMEYFLDLSRAFDLFTDEFSFDEGKPFIRLNLSGKSYGLAYVNEELACVFAEHPAAAITPSILFEIAEIFPHCLVFEKDGKICLQEAGPEVVTKTEALTALTDLITLEDGRFKLSGYNQEELLEQAHTYSGNLSFRSENRTAMIYIDRK